MPMWPTVLLLVLSLSGCGDSPRVKECTANGIAYYKALGFYPRLPRAAGPDAGRRAEDVAAETCRRSWMAFPKP